MSRRKGRPAFPGKRKNMSLYVRPKTEIEVRARSNKVNYSVSDIFEYLWTVAGPGVTRENMDRFSTRQPLESQAS